MDHSRGPVRIPVLGREESGQGGGSGAGWRGRVIRYVPSVFGFCGTCAAHKFTC